MFGHHTECPCPWKESKRIWCSWYGQWAEHFSSHIFSRNKLPTDANEHHNSPKSHWIALKCKFQREYWTSVQRPKVDHSIHYIVEMDWLLVFFVLKNYFFFHCKLWAKIPTKKRWIKKAHRNWANIWLTNNKTQRKTEQIVWTLAHWSRITPSNRNKCSKNFRESITINNF